MNISFQKKRGDPSLGIAFFWKMAIEAKSPAVITSLTENFKNFAARLKEQAEKK